MTRRDERKLVTVVVVRLTIPGQSDPEELRAGTRTLTTEVAERIRYYGGALQSTDVGYLLAAFGAAHSYEDDAERAVRAALDIRAAIQSHGGQAHVGVATGEVVVSHTQPGGGDAAPITGDVLYAAAALEASAPPGAVLVGAGTYQTTRHVIEFHPAPELTLARATGMQVWEAVTPRARTGAHVEPPTSPLIEREQELSLLQGLLQRFLNDREPYHVTIISDPGLGKSRLTAELSRMADRAPELISWRVGHARPYGQASMGALVEVVKAHANVLEGDPADVALGKVRETAATGAADAAEADRIMTDLAVLLGSGQSEGDPDRQRAHFAGWAAFLAAMATVRPLVLVLEDLQWADDVLLEFLADLPEQVGPAPLLVVCTARPEILERVQEMHGPVRNTATVSLSPLSREGTAQLLDALTGSPGLPAETKEAVVTASAGNPLYVEEYARMLEQQRPADPAPGTPQALPIPATVQQLISARLDILPLGDKLLLQDAAVLGEVGWVGALAKVSGSDSAEVEEALLRLQRRGFLRRRRRSSVAGQTEYTFQHSLVRDVAYQQILRGERAEKHRRSAAWIESLNPDPGERVERLAYHYSQAVELLRATGDLPDELVSRTAQVLRAAGDRYMNLGALASADRSYTGALELWKGDWPTRPELLFRLGRARHWRLQGKEELLEARDAFVQAGNLVRAAQASIALAQLSRNTGDPDGAKTHLSDALSFNPDDPAAEAVAAAGQVLELYVAGNLTEAIELGRDSAPKAAARGLHAEEARILVMVGMARLECGDPDGEADVARGISVFEQGHGVDVDFDRWGSVQGLVLYGDLTRVEELATRGRGLAMAGAEGTPDVVEWFDALLAVADFSAGRWDAVTGYVGQALANASGKRVYPEPWYRPVRGRVLLGRRDVDGALEDAREGRAVAELMGERRMVQPCRALEARALAASGKRGEAVALLDALLADQRGDPSRASVTPDQAALMVELGYPADALPGDLWPTRWHQAASALVARDFAKAAEVCAEASAGADEATARFLHARHLARHGEHAAARAELDRAVAFWSAAGASAYLKEAEALAATLRTPPGARPGGG